MNLLNASRESVQNELQRGVYRSHKNGARRIVVQGATGIGKTWFSGRIVRGTLEKGKNALIITHRRKLTKQMFDIMKLLGMKPSFLMAGEYYDRASPVQVACEATLKGRIKRAHYILGEKDQHTLFYHTSLADYLPPADTIIVDECHVGDNKWLTSLYPNAVIVGMTATPIKSDGTGLSDQYDDMVLGPSIRELIGMGLLLPADVLNSEGILLPNKCDKDEVPLLGKVVDNWKLHANGKCTVLYAKSVLHSRHLCSQFNAEGISAEHVDSTVSDDPGDDGISLREKAYQRLASGETKVLCNYGIVVEGVDIPQVECVVLARPNADQVMNLITYLQAIGRARRPHGEQRRVLVLDHTRTSESDESTTSDKLGHPDQDWEWKLRTTKDETLAQIERRARKPKEEVEGEVAASTEKLLHCECGTNYSPAPKCPKCGRDTPARTHIVEEVPIVLGKGGQAQLAWNSEAVKTLYRELMGYYQKKGAENWLARAVGCANGKIPEEFRLEWREIKGLLPMEPSEATKKIAFNSQRQFFLLKSKGIKKGNNGASV